MKEIRVKGIIYFQIPDWDIRDLTVHAFFTRVGGVSLPPFDSLNVGVASQDSLLNRQENLRRLSSVLGIHEQNISCLRQVHGADVVRIERVPEQTTVFTRDGLPTGDAQITDQKGTCLGILTADCVPVLLLDPLRPALGAVHAGWRSSLQGICSRTVKEMRNAFRTDPNEILALLGPSIGPCCFVIGDDVAKEFLDASPGASRFLFPAASGSWRLDLMGLNREHLIEAGVTPDHITTLPLCTSCRRDLFFSARGQGEPLGRQISVLGFRP